MPVEVDDNDEYSIEFDISSVVTFESTFVALEISSFVLEINRAVGSLMFDVETKKVSEYGVVVTIDISDIVELCFGVMLDAVDASFVCSTVEIVRCGETSATDVATVEDETDVVSTNNSVVV